MADATITTNERCLLVASGSFDDGSTGVPPAITWTTSDETIVRLGTGGYRDDGAGGIWVFGDSPGTVTISAESGTVTQDVVVEVTDFVPPPGRVLTSITIDVVSVATK